MKLLKSIKKLCTPAYVYLIISVIALVFLMFQNAGNTSKYCVGSFECDTNNPGIIFIFKGLYIAFWTLILNMLCKAGFRKISWFLVLLPFILFFVLIGMIMLTSINNTMSNVY